MRHRRSWQSLHRLLGRAASQSERRIVAAQVGPDESPPCSGNPDIVHGHQHLEHPTPFRCCREIPQHKFVERNKRFLYPAAPEMQTGFVRCNGGCRHDGWCGNGSADLGAGGLRAHCWNYKLSVSVSYLALWLSATAGTAGLREARLGAYHSSAVVASMHFQPHPSERVFKVPWMTAYHADARAAGQ